MVTVATQYVFYSFCRSKMLCGFRVWHSAEGGAGALPGNVSSAEAGSARTPPARAAIAGTDASTAPRARKERRVVGVDDMGVLSRRATGRGISGAVGRDD